MLEYVLCEPERRQQRPFFYDGERLGDAVINAKQEYVQTNPNDLDVLLGWTALGLTELFI